MCVTCVRLWLLYIVCITFCILCDEGGGSDVLVFYVRYWGFDGMCVKALKVCVGASLGIYVSCIYRYRVSMTT